MIFEVLHESTNLRKREAVDLETEVRRRRVRPNTDYGTVRVLDARRGQGTLATNEVRR